MTGLVEKPAPEEAPSNLAVVGRYVLPGDDLRRDPAHQARQRRRDPADRRDGAAARRGHAGARHRLPRHPLRHRHAAGLPAGRRAARLPARRPRPGVPAVADRLRAAELQADDRDGRRRGGRQRADAARRLPGRRAAQARPLPPLDLDLTQAHGNVLAEDVRAPARCPAFDHAAIDGYAARLEDIARRAGRGRPVRLNVVGDLAAASWRPVRLTPGHLLLGRRRRAAAGRRRRGGAGRTGPTRAWPRSRSYQAAKRGYGRAPGRRRARRPARCWPGPART